MSSEWPLKQLQDVAREITVGYVGPMASEYIEAGVPFLRSLNIDTFRINTKELKYIEPEFHRRIKKSSLRPGDVVIVRTGKPGTCAVIPDWLSDANCSDLVVVRCGEDIRPHFLCYWINSIATHHIASHTVGAVQQHFNVGAAKTMLVAVPSLQQQDRILEILCGIDDRITLLRETNKTLESIAQTVFKSWFVDFDPVRAKMEGRQPDGMDKETAALFPDAFEASELGDLPKNWKVGNFGQILLLRSERIKSGTLTRSLPYVPIESITAMNPFLENFKAGEEANSSLTRFYRGDILFGAMRPYFHKVSIAPFDGVTRTTVFVLSAKVEVARAYALFLAFEDSTVKFATHHSEGSTIPYARWKGSLELMPVVIPPEKVLKKFDNLISAVIEAAESNIKRIRVLENIRNILLPKLISGRLRMSDVAKVKEAAEI